MSRVDLPTGRLEDFDFLVGHWHVRHRCLIGTAWQEFDGTCSMRKLLGGGANLDENSWTASSSRYHALTLRTFDPDARRWSIFWLDTRWPSTFGAPVMGGFDESHGVFFGDDELGGRPIRVRFDWFVGSTDRCRWQQAFSYDSGLTWEPNWHMSFVRAGDA